MTGGPMTESCPLCGGRHLLAVLDRPNVPVHQNILVAGEAEARAVTRGDLSVVACEDCGFVFNRRFEPAKLDYGQDYDNTQTCSAHFEAYLDAIVAGTIERHDIHRGVVVEVGCGKGHFLRKIVLAAGPEVSGIGFDPTYVGPDTDLDGRLAFRRTFYDAAAAAVPADYVVCRHVIEHVPEPMALLRAVRAALASAPDARVFFETPCVDWIFENHVVWDFFYEHCSLFTARSLAYAFEAAGFAVDRADHIFGGQYLWLEARPAPPGRGAVPDPGATIALARDYAAAEARYRRLCGDRLEDLAGRGRVALWGAGAKGATFANLVDPDRRLVDCIVDVNPAKQGRYLPGTGHPIVSPAALGARGVRSAVLMNPNYLAENETIIRALGLAVELVHWSDA